MNRLQFSKNLAGGFSNKEASGKMPDVLSSPLKLNVGCGKDIKDGWINIDLYSDDPNVVKMDIRNLEIEDNKVDEILASDILEHFSHREVDNILKEWARVLKPNGIIEIRCPNLKLQMNAYLRGDWNADVASYMIFGGQTNPGDYHCVAFDKESITNHLENAGFEIKEYIEHDFPQNRGYINLNMTVKAVKIDNSRDTNVNDENTKQYDDNPFAGLEFTLDNEDEIIEPEVIEHNTNEYDDEMFDIEMLQEIVDMDSKNVEKELNIVWEGSQFVYHSLALINREHCINILKADKAELTIVPYEPDAFHHSIDDRFSDLVEKDVRFESKKDDEVSNLPYLWIRHQWPPKAEPPHGAKWIIMQPWEYSHLLTDFIDIFNNADELWTPSNYSRQAFINSGIDPDKVQVMPNGINPKTFKPNGDKYDLGTDKKLKLLFVGGTIFRKGIDVLLRAYINVFSKNDDITLIIKDIGSKTFYSGQTADNIIQRIKEDENAAEIIHIQDDLSEEEIASLYRACDIFVSPYRGEGFSLPTLEAMACGLPVMVTKGGATDDFVTEDFAWLIDSNQVSVGKTLDDKEFTGEAFALEPDQETIELTLRNIYDNPSEILSAGIIANYEARVKRTWNKATLKILSRIDAIYDTEIAKNAKLKLKDEHDAYTYLGNAEKQYIIGNMENSFELFKAALQDETLEPKYAVHALNRLAVITLNRGNPDEAMKYIEQGKDIDADHPDLLYVKALIYAGNSDSTLALETLTPLMENWITWKYESSFGVNLDDLLVLTGDIMLGVGDLEGANQLYTKALELNHKNEFACYGAGICFKQAELHDSAVEMLEWALKINPQFELAKKALEEIN